MACLSQYRAARRHSGEHVLPEIEFNFGRAFQQLGGHFQCRSFSRLASWYRFLGLHTLAVTHYEKALQLAEDRKDDVSVNGSTSTIF